MTSKMNDMIDTNLPEEGVSYLGEEYQVNPKVERSKSHHSSKEKLPGGSRYTKWTRLANWTRNILIVLVFAIVAFYLVSFLNIGSASSAPEGPSVEQANKDFLSATPPKYDSIKYISDKSSSTPTIEDVSIGRVTTSTGEGTSVYACDATATVKFSNTSINSTSKMRLKYTYNSLLSKWEKGSFTVESTNYRPNGAPDLDQVQADALALMKEYDESSANAVKDAEVTREGEITKDGGEVTFIYTKKGGGSVVSTNKTNWQSWMSNQTNGHYDLVKKMKVRVEWSEVDGWGANVTWLATEGDNSKGETQEEQKQEEEEKEEATMTLTCSSGQYVKLDGTLNANTLTLNATTLFTIDGVEITTKTITVVRKKDTTSSGSVSLSGYISSDGSTITLTI